MTSLLIAALVTDIWAGLQSRPTQVNPVAYEEFGRPAENISLAGDWEFVMRTHDAGGRTTGMEFSLVTREKWEGSMPMRVPGCWEAGGAGEEGMGVPNLCGDNAPKRLRHVHVGAGFYRKDVMVPESWRGKRVWLKIGGVLSKGWFFVNGNPVGLLEEYCGAYKYEVTDFVKAGESARIVVECDNAVASRTGRGEVNRWGGVVRDVELEATARVLINDVWVRGDFCCRKAEIHVEVEGQAEVGSGPESDLRLRVDVEGETREVALCPASVSSTNTVEVPLRSFRPWSPEHPNLYWATVDLIKGDGTLVQRVHERFGVRRLEVRGKEFYLNGRPFFFRGCGDNEPFPITGCSPADRDVHRANFRVMHDAGFNFVRLHTHGELQEYMEAADEIGVMVQPEIPYYNDSPKDDFGYDPIRDATARYHAYRRYVSYAVNSQGNEALLGPGAGKIVGDYLRKLDPDRLVLEQDGGTYIRPGHGAGSSDYCMGPLVPWPRGAFNRRAFIAHEYLNLSVRFDPRGEKDYTGLWFPPATIADRARWLAKSGLTPGMWGNDLLDAQHVLQSFWQKNGIELARQDPYCDGYCFWTITDSVVWNEKAEAFTAQGLFDPFHRQKSCGFSAKDFAVFNSQSAILLDNEGIERKMEEDPHWRRCCDPSWKICREGTNRVYESGSTIPAEFILAHYGDVDLEDPVLAWCFEANGRIFVSGEQAIGDQKAGPARCVAKVQIKVPELKRPGRYRLVAELKSRNAQAISNEWDFWFFPRRSQRPAMPGNALVVAWKSDDEQMALASGRHVVSLANQAGTPNYAIGWWWIGKQSGTVFKEHPMLAGLPYEKFLAPMYFSIVKEGLALPVDGFSEKDLVAVGEGAAGCYVYLAERTLPNGAKHVLVAGLDVTTPSLVGDALLDGIFMHLKSCRTPVCQLTN